METQPKQSEAQKQRQELARNDVSHTEELAHAEKMLHLGKPEIALDITSKITRIHPEWYWGLALHARVLGSTGKTKEATTTYQEAWRLRRPESVGAALALAYPRVKILDSLASHDIKDITQLLDEAIEMCADNNPQKRWNYSKLLVLRSLVYLGNNELPKANTTLNAAYEYERSINEKEFDFEWISRLAPLRIIPPRYNAIYWFLTALATPNDPGLYERILDKLEGNQMTLIIGANDGVKTDSLYEHIVNKKWDSVLVEPVSENYNRLLQNYKDCPWARPINVALTNETTELTIYRVDPSKMSSGGRLDPAWAEGVATLDPSHLLKHYPDAVISERCAGMTFQDLEKEMRIEELDILQIDCEGADWDVLSSIPIRKYKPKLVHIEICNLMPESKIATTEYLFSCGYIITYNYPDLTAILPPDHEYNQQ